MILSAPMKPKTKPVDEDMETASIIEYFGEIPDPRVDRTRLHPLPSVLVLSLMAVICGAESFVAIEMFGKARKDWLETFLEFPNGIPSHDTIGRIFAMLNPDALGTAFRDWMAAVAKETNGGVVALDGKTLRRSFRKRGCGFVHMVSAWSAANRVVLAQVKTEEKSNEITAIPRLLDLLQITGCVVTIDAMGCQKDIADKIVNGGADYMLAVKDNQPTLAADMVAVFQSTREDPEMLATMDFHSTTEKGHGRHETRRCWTSDRIDLLSQHEQWRKLHTIALVESERTIDGKTTLEQRYYICSRANLPAKAALADSRSHWGIENGLHWVLDVAFREDDCRVRAGYAGQNFAVLRHIALNLLKSVKGSKVGILNRRLRAAWDESFLLDVLGAL